MRPQPLIAVTDVEASSRWYQRLPGCRSDHGGSQYERLVSNGQLVLQLHSFGVEHHHGPIGDRDHKPYGNGVLLWFEVDDFEAVIHRAIEMGVEIVIPGIETHRMVTADRIIGSAGWVVGYFGICVKENGTSMAPRKSGPKRHIRWRSFT